MKLFFVKEDSLYKIFKTLEKIPKKKQVQFFFDAEHPLFENERRGRQIKEIIDKREIDAHFVTKCEQVKIFFENIGCQVNYQGTRKIQKVFNLLYLFLFNIKKFHLHTFNKKDTKRNTTLLLIYGFELLVILGILALLYLLILPTTTITITPNQEIDPIIYNFRYYTNTDKTYPANSRNISIPYYTGHLDYKYDLTINTNNTKYTQHPARGKIKIINKLPYQFNFVKNTTFITDEGLLFKSLHPIHIPRAYNDIPGETIISIIAKKEDNQGTLMGSRGKIKKNTSLYVKNIKQSLLLKQMIAISMEDFSSTVDTSTGVTQQADLDILGKELESHIKNNKLTLAKKIFNLEDSVLLNFDKTTSFKIISTDFDTKAGEYSDRISGTITARLYFIYVKWKDIEKAFKKFLKQRPMRTNKVLSLDKSSFFIITNSIKQDNTTYIIPTKINAIKGYDFTKDINGIVSDIKDSIIGKDKNTARNIILKYDEVGSAAIKISPPWSRIIPKIKSRIKINTVY